MPVYQPGLTFPLPVIYIREEAHGGFSMPRERRGSDGDSGGGGKHGEVGGEEGWRIEPVPWGLTQ